MMILETHDSIRLRRSVRRYTAQPVDRQLLQELLEDACWAPSGDNHQPWYLLALTDGEDRRRLESIMQRVSRQLRPHLEGLFAAHPEVVADVTGFLANMGAPVYVLAFLRKDYGEARDQVMMSTAAAVENLILSARDQGLGSCWIYAAHIVGVQEQIRAAFAPERGELLGLVSLGYPAVVPKAPARKPDRWEIR